MTLNWSVAYSQSYTKLIEVITLPENDVLKSLTTVTVQINRRGGSTDGGGGEGRLFDSIKALPP